VLAGRVQTRFRGSLVLVPLPPGRAHHCPACWTLAAFGPIPRCGRRTQRRCPESKSAVLVLGVTLVFGFVYAVIAVIKMM
jgi:hypothetical protein